MSFLGDSHRHYLVEYKIKDNKNVNTFPTYQIYSVIIFTFKIKITLEILGPSWVTAVKNASKISFKWFYFTIAKKPKKERISLIKPHNILFVKAVKGLLQYFSKSGNVLFSKEISRPWALTTNHTNGNYALTGHNQNEGSSFTWSSTYPLISIVHDVLMNHLPEWQSLYVK